MSADNAGVAALVRRAADAAAVSGPDLTQAGNGRRGLPARTVRAAIACAAVAIVGLLAVPAQAAAPAAAVPVLGAKNEISGSRMSSHVVRLERATAVDVRAFARSMKITGGGRVRGIVLTKQGEGERIFVSTMSVSFCDSPGCLDKEPVLTAPSRAFRDKASRALLAAGQYRLYLLADTKPVRVTFSLPGQRGTLRLQPRQPEANGVMTPTVVRELKAESNDVAYSSGTSLKTDAPGAFVMYAIKVTRSRQWVQGLFAICTHRGRPPVDALAFQPGCADADENYGVGDGVINPGLPGFPEFDRTYLGFTHIEKAGENAFGGHLSKLGVADDVQARLFALDFANAGA